jgi:hypothetical protein
MWCNLISGTAYQWRCVRAVIHMSGTIIMFLCCKTHVSTGEAKNKIKPFFFFFYTPRIYTILSVVFSLLLTEFWPTVLYSAGRNSLQTHHNYNKPALNAHSCVTCGKIKQLRTKKGRNQVDNSGYGFHQ